MRSHPVLSALPLLVLVHCAHAPDAGTTTPTRAQSRAPTTSSTAPSGPESAAPAEVRTLLTDVLAPQLCPKLLGSFIGLPGEGSATGPAAGTLASAGRWWIRSCNTRVVDERIELSIGGPGWSWVDRESTGFRVRQYVFFEAGVQLGADVSVGYDRDRRVASLWMRPGSGVTARVTPIGAVTAEATNAFAALIGGLLPITGSSASDRARAQAGEIGSTQMRERLAVGFTMTFSMADHQVDFMVGALARGETPERPFARDPRGPWQVNQRVQVFPGGLDVVGPIELQGAPVGLDLEVEEGEGVVVRSVCAQPFSQYLDARLRNPAAAPPTPPGSRVVLDTPGGTGLRHVVMPPADCPTILLLSHRPGAGLPLRARLRVMPEPAPDTAPAGTGTTASSSASVPARLGRFRLRIEGVTVAEHNPAGRDWDVVGGDADPYVTVTSIPQRREVDRTPVVANQRNARWDRWVSGVFDAATDLPLRFTVDDDDTTGAELIGRADLDPADLPPAPGGDLVLPVRSEGATPVQTATLRIHVESAQ